MERREKRMLDAMVAHGNRNARLVATVTLTRQDGRELHQTFRFKAWKGSSGGMLTADLMDGDWAAGVPNTKVVHVPLENGVAIPARNDRGGRYDDKLVIYAAKAAVRWLLEGDVPRPANGTIAVTLSDFCACCGRELTDDTSIRLGIGPECEKKVYGTATRRSGTVAGRREAAPPVYEDGTIVLPLNDLLGASGFAIMQGGVKVGWDATAADALETAERFVTRGSRDVTVVDEASGELVAP